MNRLYAAAVERLSRIPGVRGALVVEGETGVPVVSDMTAGVNETAVAALAASLFRRTGEASTAADFGRLHTLQLEAAGGHVIAVGTRDLILVAVTERTAQVGLIRYEAQRAAESLA
jgi:predicted regulator of Ras-like GTPase activity (Roadblock/LC7/MglB family)